MTLTGTLAAAILDKMHQEVLQYPIEYQNSHDVVTRLAESNVDWKAWAGVAGALVVKNAVSRIVTGYRRHEDTPDQIDHLMTTTPKERRRERWRQRIVGSGISILTGTVAYQAAEHASMEHVAITNGVALGGALVQGLVAEYRANRQAKHSRE